MTSSPSSSSTMGQAMERATPWKRGLYTRCLLLLASMVLWSLLFAFLFSNTSGPSFTATTLRSPRASRLVGKQQNSHGPARTSRIAPDSPCAGKYVYMHKLPPQFNQAMLQECRRLSLWTNMCKFTANSGLGPPLQEPGWFATNQFSLDIIFHNRMKQYRCLTNNSSQAVVLYVPFYAGLDISRHLWGANISTRDAASLALAAWLRRRPEWAAMGGQDHFLVGGRITWDFRRLTDRESDWGNKLLYLPEIANMSMLVVEASPFHTNDYAIPYPTYFHPSQDSDMKDWQERVSSYSNRSTLFSFAGAPRPDIATSIRGHIIEQCKQSRLCKLLECGKGESKCHSPSTVMRLFRDSVFCLQPQGDSFTRRSIFDSMICGCIPVFFHPDSAYSQYIWHLPRNHSAYSVFIPEDDVKKDNNSIEAILSSIPAEDILRLRLAVINLIPGLIYADPRQHLKTTKDAFDIAIQALVDKVTNLRVQVAQGREDKDAQTMDGNKKLLTSSRPREGSENATRHWEGQRWKGEQGYMETIEEVWSRDRAKKEAARGRKAFNREASSRSLKSLMRFRLDPPLDESSSDSNHNHPA